MFRIPILQQVYLLGVFSVCVFFGCLHIYWVFFMVSQFVDESAKTKSFEIYLFGW